MSAVKVSKYTDAQIAEMVDAYSQAPTIETVQLIAEKFDKNINSVIAKLAKEKVYISKSRKVNGKREMLKSELVSEIAKFLFVDEDRLESLEKATSPALSLLLTQLRKNSASGTKLAQP